MPKEAAFIVEILLLSFGREFLRIRYLMTIAGDEWTYIYFYKYYLHLHFKVITSYESTLASLLPTSGNQLAVVVFIIFCILTRARLIKHYKV